MDSPHAHTQDIPKHLCFSAKICTSLGDSSHPCFVLFHLGGPHPIESCSSMILGPIMGPLQGGVLCLGGSHMFIHNTYNKPDRCRRASKILSYPPMVDPSNDHWPQYIPLGPLGLPTKYGHHPPCSQPLDFLQQSQSGFPASQILHHPLKKLKLDTSLKLSSSSSYA